MREVRFETNFVVLSVDCVASKLVKLHKAGPMRSCQRGSGGGNKNGSVFDNEMST